MATKTRTHTDRILLFVDECVHPIRNRLLPLPSPPPHRPTKIHSQVHFIFKHRDCTQNKWKSSHIWHKSERARKRQNETERVQQANFQKKETWDRGECMFMWQSCIDICAAQNALLELSVKHFGGYCCSMLATICENCTNFAIKMSLRQSMHTLWTMPTHTTHLTKKGK